MGRSRIGANLQELLSQFPNSTAYIECGAYCGDGWKDILAKVMPVLEATGARVSQIKEKFGGLRLYWDPPEEEMPFWHRVAVNMAIEQAESASFKTCEQCGAAGKKRNDDGWINMRCDACPKR